MQDIKAHFELLCFLLSAVGLSNRMNISALSLLTLAVPDHPIMTYIIPISPRRQYQMIIITLPCICPLRSFSSRSTISFLFSFYLGRIHMKISLKKLIKRTYENCVKKTRIVQISWCIYNPIWNLQKKMMVSRAVVSSFEREIAGYRHWTIALR